MQGHNVFHMPMEKQTQNLPWFETDVGVRRLSWVFGGVLLLYWGWFLSYLALSMDQPLVMPKVLVGLVPLVLLGALAARRPRLGGICTMVLGLVAAAVMVPSGVDVAVMLTVLSVAAGGLMYFSAHR